ncbi:hypothetical protein [Williamwhitmania taraxaci]|uniref:hypothetical protein n=1 Tax=Williamwhitmania taraxaci TaxID=1640674 RepID=UPI000F7AA075|nr:hypothetical protein [Williamwhitmania taraxaci]
MSANDTLKSWKTNNLQDYEFLNLYACRIDSLMCFNSSNNKLIGAILVSNEFSYTNFSDGITIFNGVRIKKNWYFFTGASIVLPREYYEKDIHTPLSFEKLHEIAMKEVFSGYLKKNLQGKWEVNEDFFGSITNYDAYNYPYSTQDSYDKSVLKLVRANWENRGIK